jgi:hypothetical protein
LGQPALREFLGHKALLGQLDPLVRLGCKALQEALPVLKELREFLGQLELKDRLVQQDRVV